MTQKGALPEAHPADGPALELFSGPGRSAYRFCKAVRSHRACRSRGHMRSPSQATWRYPSRTTRPFSERLLAKDNEIAGYDCAYNSCCNGLTRFLPVSSSGCQVSIMRFLWAPKIGMLLWSRRFRQMSCSAAAATHEVICGSSEYAVSQRLRLSSGVGTRAVFHPAL